MKSLFVVVLLVVGALSAPTNDVRDKRGLLLAAPAAVAVAPRVIAAPVVVSPAIAAPAAVAVAPRLIAAPALTPVIATSAIAPAPIITGASVISSGIIAH